MTVALSLILIALAYSLAQSVYWVWRVYTRQVFVLPALPAIEDEIPFVWPPSRVIETRDSIPF